MPHSSCVCARVPLGLPIGTFMNSDRIIKEVKNQNEEGRLEGEESKLVKLIRKICF